MKAVLVSVSALLCLSNAGCVAGPGGSNNVANRTVAGVALGALLGGVAGKAGGQAASGLVLGAIAGGAAGALINPNGLGPHAEGECQTLDPNGQPITILTDEAGCRIANGQVDVAGQP